MASSSVSSVLGSSDDTLQGTKLMRLILDGGTEALRNAFRKIHPRNLQVVLSTNQHILSNLNRNIINQSQWDKLYPASPKLPDINDFDITLLSILLRNICGLSPPSSGWAEMPNVSDDSFEADIVRIKLFRNERFAHVTKTAVSTANFKSFWAEISVPLVRLGIDQKEIDRLEKEKCGPEEVARLLKEWNEFDGKIINALEDVLNVSNESQNVSRENQKILKDIKSDTKELLNRDDESRSDGVLSKHLVWCDFNHAIELHYGKFVNGTREWVFEQVLSWFNNETSKHRAFVIAGHAGMGKSVIAAVICKRFAEHVGASHFFQYNNSRYNSPTFFLRSLAWHICKRIPAYSEALIKKLSENFGRSLNDMDIEGLFSTLFEEPFSGIADSEKRMLIVLDAVDECEYQGRRAIAKLISSHFHKLPTYFRFVITTRREKKLLDTFTKFNPLSIEANDERNLSDIKLVLEERTSCINRSAADLINTLAERSQGLMLVAYFLSETYKDDSTMFIKDSLPKDVEQYYENYFQRLERELKALGISEDKFLFFLSALVVANEPLPEAFVATLFLFENTPSSRRNVKKATNALSSLLVIGEDKSISFFHKSIRDWLVDSEHDFSVDEQHGHKVLFKLCVAKLDELKENGVSRESLASTALRYALKNWIPHMLKGLGDSGNLQSFVSDYVANLEVTFASVHIDVDLTLKNITDLTHQQFYKLVSENTRTSVSRSLFLIRKFDFFLKHYPQTFLQNVLNEGGDELSSEASKLLETRYKNIFYLELVKKDRTNHALKACCHLSGTISGIDISPQHDYVVCSYEEGGIELFSLTTGKAEWKKQDFTVTLDDSHDAKCMLPHCIVFHPHENTILPGRLDKVLNLEGCFTKGTFECDEGSSVFTNCCFSQDRSKMVTYHDAHGNNLVLWDVFSGTKETCFPCERLYSFSFTASGNFLGTTDVGNVFTVYDVTNTYNANSIRIDSEFPVEIVSTSEQNSWFCSLGPKFQIVNDNLSQSSEFYPMGNAVLPSNIHSSQDIKCFLEHPERSWLSRIMGNLHDLFWWSRNDAIRYFLIKDISVLFFSCCSNIMYVFSIEGLIDTEEPELNMNQDIFSKISTNGDFVYLNNGMTQQLTACKLDSEGRNSKPYQRSGEFDILVVRDGLILHGEGQTPELWNGDLTQHLESFVQLTGTKSFLSVSDEVIACLYDHGYINFFNVFTRQIVDKVIFAEKVRSVHACSIKSLVLAQMESSEFSLLKEGKQVRSISLTEDFRNVMSGIYPLEAEFSPEGNRLALSSVENTKVFIYDVTSECFLATVIKLSDGSLLGLKFFDDKSLLLGSSNHMLYFYNLELENAEILTCLDVGDSPCPISVCRKRTMACVGLRFSEYFELIKVCPPRV